MTFLLTGGASGIGRRLVKDLVERGHSGFATDVNLAGLEAAARADGWPADRVGTLALDVRSASAWQAALDATVARFGAVELLCNIAGYLKPGYCHELAVEEIDRHLDINVKGIMLGTRVVGAYLASRGAGHIVNIGSLASLAPVPGLGLYAASKFAVRGFSLASAQELLPLGVAVSLVMPDAVQTPMLDLQVDYPEAAITFSGSAALSVEQIANLICDEVLPHRPLEVTIPLGRGALARFANLFPAVAAKLGPRFAKKGAAEQARRKTKP